MVSTKKISLLKSLFSSSDKYFSGLFEDISNIPDDVIHYRIGNKHAYFLKNPEDVKHVLLDNHANYVKGDQFEILTPLVGKGVASVGDYQQWRKQRHAIAPAFHNKMMEHYSTMVVDQAAKTLTQWQINESQNTPINISHAMERLAFGMALKGVLNLKANDDIENYYRATSYLLRYLEQQIMPLDRFKALFPNQRKKRYHSSLKIMDDFLYKTIAEYQPKEGHTDLVGMVMSAYQEKTGAYSSPKQVRDELATMLVSGYETVSTLLSWVWVLLSKHPDIERKLSEELKQVLNGRLPTYEDLPKLKYTHSIVQEVLRLYPPAWMLVRKAVEADTIRDYQIPKNADIFIFIYSLHRHPNYWINPEGFDPDRFMENHQAELKHIYCPFGVGHRSCIGSTFAMMEAQLIIATIAQHFYLELLPGYTVKPVPGLTLKPQGTDLIMKLRKKTS